MSLLSYNRLVQLVEQGVITADPENINGASIDLTLGNTFIQEAMWLTPNLGHGVDLAKKENIEGQTIELRDDDQFVLYPGQFCLASTREIFNLPNNIAAEYKLKSSMARNGLEHLNAGWCDPGWTGSTLTLELKNMTQHHDLILTPGMKIGQIVFFECEAVPEDRSYATKGQYNNQTTTQASKGIR